MQFATAALQTFKFIKMKKLSRVEMKQVMGGYPPPVGCVYKCCVTGDGGCNEGNQYGVSTYSVATCEEGDTVCSLGGGIKISCSCQIGGF